MNREQVKQKIYEKKVKKALKCYRCRGLKNFLFWLCGASLSFILFASALFVGLKVVPISVYTGGKENEYVSEEVASKTILDAIMSYKDFKVEDFPVVETLISDLLADTGMSSYFSVDYEKLKGINFFYPEGSDTTLVNELYDCITVTASLKSVGLLEELQDLQDLNVFTWEQVPADVESSIDTGAEGFNASLYWYDTEESGSGFSVKQAKSTYTADVSEIKYKRAYEEIVAGDNVTYRRVADSIGKKLYYANLAEVPITDVIGLFDERLGQASISSIVGLVTKDDNPDSIISKLLEGETISSIAALEDASVFLNRITLSSLISLDSLGTFKELDVFKWTEVKAEDIPETDAEGLVDIEKNNPALYYFDANKDSRVFDENGKWIDGAREIKYYINLAEVTITDLIAGAGASFGRMPFTNILDVIDVELDEDNIIYKVLGDKTIAQMGEIGEDIYLDWVLPYSESTKSTYKLILGAIPGKEYTNDAELEALAKDLKVNELELAPDNIKLEDVLPKFEDDGVTPKNEVIYDILEGANLDENGDNDGFIELGELTNLTMDNIKLSTFLEINSSNELLYKILLQSKLGDAYNQLTWQNDAEDLTIADVTIDINKVKLSTVLTSPDETLKNILTQACGDFDSITISALSSLNINGVLLKTVMPYNATENGAIYSILCDATGETVDTLTIGHISSGFNLDNVKLNSVLPASENEKLYELLLENAPTKTEETLTIGDINFDLSTVKLSTVMEGNENAMLEKIFDDVFASKGGYDGVTVTDLGSFDISAVKLSTVFYDSATGTVKSTDNRILDAVIAKDCTISEIGDTINALTLYEIFGETCFIAENAPDIATEKLDGSPKFKRVLESYVEGGVSKQHYVYIHVADDENIAGTEYYYLHKDDGIWLLLCFKGENMNTNPLDDLMYGRPERYVVSDLDMSALEDASAMSSLFTDATLRQLMDAGILDYNSNKTIWNMTLNELVSSIS